jgi:2-polyprenyl-3-methyl-5-hydroxy-6-metoxy-1,4-benzoquinol methylase
MRDDDRRRLFQIYDRHVEGMDPSDDEKLRWFREYFLAHYAPHLASMGKEAEILEIGCGRGFLLQVLSREGYRRLTGIDRSPGDLERARRSLPGATLRLGDAVSLLRRSRKRYGAILLKAVLEHIPKRDVLPFLRALVSHLEPDGRLIVDVPNMDWIHAQHERYMDFTHEGGFTRESLRQALSDSYEILTVFPADNHPGRRFLGKVRARWARAALGTLLGWADPDLRDASLWERSLIAVALPRKS